MKKQKKISLVFLSQIVCFLLKTNSIKDKKFDGKYHLLNLILDKLRSEKKYLNYSFIG